MSQGRYVAMAAVAVVAVLAVAVAVIQFTGDNGEDDLAGLPGAPDDPTATAEPGDPDGLGDRDDLDEFMPPDMGLPPEVEAFLQRFDLAGSVIHFTLEQESAQQEGAPAAESYAIGDFWIEIDDEDMPVRLVVRFFDRDGQMLEAIYSDGEEEVVALIHEARLGSDLPQGCVNRGPASFQLFMQIMPFAVEGPMLEVEGFEGASERIEGAGPTTSVDERIGDPQRTVALPPWAEADQYERGEDDEPMRAIVVLHPDTSLLLGQVLLQEGDNGAEVQFRQALGDIHVHDRGSTEPAFDFQDAIALCEELES